MAITGLNLPIDIPWERICVARDMVDPGRGVAAETPPLWQSSIALFRYVPPDEYQVYPGRRILYYKLTCTITNYQPRDQQVLGTIDLYGLPMDVKPLVKKRGTRPTLASASRAVKRLPFDIIFDESLTRPEQNRHDEASMSAEDEP